VSARVRERLQVAALVAVVILGTVIVPTIERL
jgi:hypothetical protein